MKYVSVAPVTALEDEGGDKPFTLPLPIDVGSGVLFSNIEPYIVPDLIESAKESSSPEGVKLIENATHGFVHVVNIPDQSSWQSDEGDASIELIRKAKALMNLIRPMREGAQPFQLVEHNYGTSCRQLDHPFDHHVVLELQRVWGVRDDDLRQFVALFPAFLTVFKPNGEYFPLRSAVRHALLSHIINVSWEASFLLSVVGIDALVTGDDPKDQGAQVASERVIHLLGRSTPVYQPWDLPSFLPKTDMTVEQALKGTYRLRNKLAHGAVIPTQYLGTGELSRIGIGGEMNQATVIVEASVTILRRAIRRCLEPDLVEHFKSKKSTNHYFRSQGLVASQIRTDVDRICEKKLK